MMFLGYGVGNAWVFWFLRLLLIGVFVYAGYGIAYGKKEDFGRYAWPAGILYSLIEGLRWLRGADYPHYYNDLVTVFNTYPGAISERYTPDPEILYEAWINFFHFTGLPFWVAFIFYSAILIWGVLLIFKLFPKAALWGLPLFFILTVNSTENIIRQYFSASFVIFGFYFYFKGNYKNMIIMLIIAPLIHYSSLLAEVPFLFLIAVSPYCGKLLESKAVPVLLCLLYAYVYFLFDSASFSHLATFLSSQVDTVGDEKASTYLSNADRWFTDEGSMSRVLTGKAAGAIGMINNMVRFLSYLVIIYFGYIAIKDDKKLLFAYVFSYLAILAKVGGGDIEMFGRIYNWYVVLMPLIIGRIMTSQDINKDLRIGFAALFVMFFVWYGMMSSMFSTSIFGYGFIWDAKVPLF